MENLYWEIIWDDENNEEIYVKWSYDSVDIDGCYWGRVEDGDYFDSLTAAQKFIEDLKQMADSVL